MPSVEERESFTGFVAEVGPRLKQALIAALGGEAGREATADALAWAWEHWSKLRTMGNPAGYLYVLGKNRGFAQYRRRPHFPLVEASVGDDPWVEPGLPQALAHLSEMQRVSVMLLNGFGWTYREVAAYLGISAGSVQKHAQRAMVKLREELKVRIDA